MAEQNPNNLTIRFELNDAQYSLFKKKVTSLNIRSTASRLKTVDFYYRENEYNGNHLVEMGLKNLKDSPQYDLVGTITRQNNNRQSIDLLGQYVNTTNEDYREIIDKKDIRELPCSVCGKKLKTRRKMYLMIDNETGEYEYVGNECVSKLMPEWSMKAFRDLFAKLIKLQALFQEARTEQIPEVPVEEVMKEEYAQIKSQLTPDGSKGMDELKQIQDKFLDKKLQKLNRAMYNFYLFNSAGTSFLLGTPSGKGSLKINFDQETKKVSFINKLQGFIGDPPYFVLQGQMSKDPKGKEIADNFQKGLDQFKKNLSVEKKQYDGATNKIKELAQFDEVANNHPLTFEESIERIQRNRQWPNKPGYNLRELVNAKTVKANMVGKIKENYKKFVLAQNNGTDSVNVDEVEQKINEKFNNSFNQSIFDRLNELDQSFYTSSKNIYNILQNLQKSSSTKRSFY